MKLQPPNPVKITKFLVYHFLAGEYFLMGIERFFGRFTHYEVNTYSTDEEGKRRLLVHDYLPKSWVERGTYS